MHHSVVLFGRKLSHIGLIVAVIVVVAVVVAVSLRML